MVKNLKLKNKMNYQNWLYCILILITLSCYTKKTKINKDAEAMSYILAAECLKCEDSEIIKISTVIKNRLLSSEYPKTIDSIISETNQFHGYCKEWYVYDRRCYELACYVLARDDTLNGILFFWKKGNKKPRYVKKKIYTEKFHSFGK